MGKKSKNKKTENKIVRSVNKNVRSSTRKLKPILKSIVGKKVGEAIKEIEKNWLDNNFRINNDELNSIIKKYIQIKYI